MRYRLNMPRKKAKDRPTKDTVPDRPQLTFTVEPEFWLDVAQAAFDCKRYLADYSRLIFEAAWSAAGAVGIRDPDEFVEWLGRAVRKVADTPRKRARARSGLGRFPGGQRDRVSDCTEKPGKGAA